MRLLFQGDSITDALRDKRNYFDLGNGYPKYAAELIKTAHPELDIEFINLGISGNRTSELFDRIYTDAISLKPDVISILIGINDICHRYGYLHIPTSYEQIELNYRCILKELKASTNAKIIILSPYLLEFDGDERIKEDVPRLFEIVRNLAKEYADAYVPLDELFALAMKEQPSPKYYSADGVHPNENGAKFIAEHYKKAFDSLL